MIAFIIHILRSLVDLEQFFQNTSSENIRIPKNLKHGVDVATFFLQQEPIKVAAPINRPEISPSPKFYQLLNLLPEFRFHPMQQTLEEMPVRPECCHSGKVGVPYV